MVEPLATLADATRDMLDKLRRLNCGDQSISTKNLRTSAACLNAGARVAFADMRQRVQASKGISVPNYIS